MRNRIINSLKLVASENYVRRFGIDGSADEYIVLEEVVDKVCSEAESPRKSDYIKKTLTTTELNALDRFATIGRIIEKELNLDDPILSNEEIINSDSWNKLRNEARVCLKVFGINEFEDVDI